MRGHDANAGELAPDTVLQRAFLPRAAVLTIDMFDPMDADNETEIIDSWHKNASPWIAAVRAGQIESRELVTNQAIVEVILSLAPRAVLDVGCGEGWLAREIVESGARVLGVDAVPGLIESARAAGDDGEFQVASYGEIASGGLGGSFDAVVCNFSLLGKESVEKLLGAASLLLNPHGTFIVQTLHPPGACGDLPYIDGWRAGSWDGFTVDFTDPPPWYFRTMESWVTLLSKNGLQLVELREPIHPGTRKPLSVIFIAELADDNSPQRPALTGRR